MHETDCLDVFPALKDREGVNEGTVRPWFAKQPDRPHSAIVALEHMTEDNLEEMESDLENDRVWSDAVASYAMIRQAREIVNTLTTAASGHENRVVAAQMPLADATGPAA